MIEALITELIGSLKENTQALRDVLAASGNTVVEKPAKAKKEKPELTVVAAPEPAAETVTEAPAPEETVTEEPETVTEAPAPEETVTEDAPDWDRTTYLLKITEFVKGKLVADGASGKVKADYEAIRSQFGVKKAPDLADDQLFGFWQAIQAL